MSFDFDEFGRPTEWRTSPSYIVRNLLFQLEAGVNCSQMLDYHQSNAICNRVLNMSEPKQTIIYSSNEVINLGEKLHEPIYWIGRQWAVTKFGIEARDGKYPIEAGRLWETTGEHGWQEHMAEKSWVDKEDFNTALLVARGIWGLDPATKK